jgi:hypothetical protein
MRFDGQSRSNDTGDDHTLYGFSQRPFPAVFAMLIGARRGLAGGVCRPCWSVSVGLGNVAEELPTEVARCFG